MSQVKIKTSGKIVIGLLILASVYFGKTLWWDKRPHEVQASQSVGKVSIPDAPESSLSGTAAVKLDLPSKDVASNGGTKINWFVMAWQSQNGFVYANGGKETTKGSLFDKNNLDVSIIRQDNCSQSCAELVKFCKSYKDDPSTPGVFITFMGSGIPAYITGISEAVKDLGPDYQPVAFLSTGKSFGEDQLLGDKKYKDNKNLLKGAVCIGVRMDGDQDLALKLANDNGIKVNTDETTWDADALNLMYPTEFIEAVTKYNSGYTETRKIVVNGKTTGKDTTITPNIVATWTPGDVQAYEGKGGVTIISTREYASMMPNITITCKKWLNDHRTDAENITIAAAMAGDQIRSFSDVKLYACGLNVDVYGEQSAKWWLDYYNGVKVNEDTHLGGSMVFNLADMANLFGLAEDNKNDIYKAVYNTFGTLQSKYYPNDLAKYLEYNKAFDKSILLSVISNHPELLEGKVNKIDYSEKMETKVGDKSYHIEFETGSAVIKEASYSVLDEIVNDVTVADGLKVQISGHSDASGNADLNLVLSEKRANSVKEYLVMQGIKAVRTSVKGYGSTQPVADNSTAAGRAENRRVEIELLGK